MKLGDLLGIKKKVGYNKIKKYFLWIPILKAKSDDCFVNFYILGIRVLRFNVSQMQCFHYTQIIEAKPNTEKLNLKAFELIQTRKNCHYLNKEVE